MAPRGPAWLAIVSVAITLSACATKLDFDAVSAGERIVDAGRDGDVSNKNPTRDASARDASSIPPAERDAAVRVDAASSDAGKTVTPFDCAALTPPPTFCEDFEQPNLSARWLFQEVKPASAGSVDLDSTSALSGQGSLLAVLNANVTNACLSCVYATLGRTFSDLTQPSRITVDVDLNVELVDPTVDRRAAVFRFGFVDGSQVSDTVHTVEVISIGARAVSVFAEYLSGDPMNAREYDAFAGPPLQRWVHLRYQLDVTTLRGSGNHLSVKLDEAELFAGNLAHPLRSNTPFLDLGFPSFDNSTIDAENPNGSWRARFDNLVVRVEPL